MSTKQPETSQIIRQSLLGILLGIGGGIVFFWFIYPIQPAPLPKAQRRSQSLRREPVKPQKLSKETPVEEVYRRASSELQRQVPGEVFAWLQEGGREYLMRPHLLWQMAERFFYAGRSIKAIALYKELLKQRQTLWSKKRLYYRIAYAYWNAHQRPMATIYLKRSMELAHLRGRQGWSWLYKERQEAAAAYRFYANFVGKEEQLKALTRLWLGYPDTIFVLKAEQQWWQLLKRRSFKLGSWYTPFLLDAVEQYLGVFHEPRKAKRLLKVLSGKLLSRKQKRKYKRLKFRWSLRWGSQRVANKAFKKLLKSLPHKKQGGVSYQHALMFLRRGKLRKFKRAVKKIRRARRYWRSRGERALARWYLRRKKLKKARKHYQRAWKQRRSKSFRAGLFFELGMTSLLGRKARRARKYFKGALKLSRRGNPQIEYWLARSEEKIRKKKQATRRYQELYQKRGLSYYGFLAAERLRKLNALKPIKHIEPDSPALHWDPKGLSDARGQRLAILKKYGPQELYVLELERHALRLRRPPVNLLLELARQNLALKQPHVAIQWLEPTVQKKLHDPTPPSQPLLVLGFPQPKTIWTEILKAAEQQHLDPHMIAALIHQRSQFEPTYHKGRFIGLMGLHPLWNASYSTKIPINLMLGTQRLQKLKLKYRSMPFALQAYIDPTHFPLKKMSRVFRNIEPDLQAFLLSSALRKYLHTYRLYQLLYVLP